MGTYIMLYTDNNNEFFPAASQTGYKGLAGSAYWPGYMMDQRYITSGSILNCPEKPYSFDFHAANKMVSNSTSFCYVNYGISYNLAFVKPPGESTNRSAKRSEIRSPTRMIAMLDTYRGNDRTNGYYMVWSIYTTGSSGAVDARHLNAVNVIWGDGHVTSEKSKTVGTCEIYSAVNNPYLYGPFSNGGTWGATDNYWDFR